MPSRFIGPLLVLSGLFVTTPLEAKTPPQWTCPTGGLFWDGSCRTRDAVAKRLVCSKGAQLAWVPNAAMVIAVCKTKDDKQHGPRVTWNANGALLTAYTYRNGKRHGRFQHSYKNGPKHTVGRYRDGLLDGALTTYLRSGKVQGKTTFRRGTGRMEAYFGQTRKVKISEAMVAGERHGWRKQYHRSGKLAYKVRYHQGKRQGLSQRLNADGTLVAVACHDRGEKVWAVEGAESKAALKRRCPARPSGVKKRPSK